jgi:hypothetical protein
LRTYCIYCGDYNADAPKPCPCEETNMPDPTIEPEKPLECEKRGDPNRAEVNKLDEYTLPHYALALVIDPDTLDTASLAIEESHRKAWRDGAAWLALLRALPYQIDMDNAVLRARKLAEGMEQQSKTIREHREHREVVGAVRGFAESGVLESIAASLKSMAHGVGGDLGDEIDAEGTAGFFDGSGIADKLRGWASRLPQGTLDVRAELDALADVIDTHEFMGGTVSDVDTLRDVLGRVDLTSVAAMLSEVHECIVDINCSATPVEEPTEDTGGTGDKSQ